MRGKRYWMDRPRSLARTMETNPSITISDVASRLGISRKTVWSLVKQGRIPEPRQRVGVQGIYLWKESDLGDIIAGYTSGQRRRSRKARALTAAA